jgi:hypothetical protein
MGSITAGRGLFFRDVPKNHWARESIKELMCEGIIQAYEPLLFRGEMYANRYHAAVTVAKLLHKHERYLDGPHDIKLQLKLLTDGYPHRTRQ